MTYVIFISETSFWIPSQFWAQSVYICDYWCGKIAQLEAPFSLTPRKEEKYSTLVKLWNFYSYFVFYLPPNKKEDEHCKAAKPRKLFPSNFLSLWNAYKEAKRQTSCHVLHSGSDSVDFFPACVPEAFTVTDHPGREHAHISEVWAVSWKFSKVL